MEISYKTFQLLLDLGDEEAYYCRECNDDQECHASRNCEGRLDFRFFFRNGHLTSEGYLR